jgi:uncharacterized glyoxalase superfamily protein PhnB
LQLEETIMADAPQAAGLSSSVFYRDPKAALTWLERAFGFEIAFMVLDDDGNLGHSQMVFGTGRVSINGEWEAPDMVGEARMRSPLSVEGVNTQFVRVDLAEDIDAHCERARAAGARITQEPRDEFYGHRTYRALDPEGHVWSFGAPIAVISDEAKARGAQWTIREADRAARKLLED